MLGILSAMAMIGTEMPHQMYKHTKPKETDEQRKRRIAKGEIVRNKANGLTQFFYGISSVWALNQKNADKKARSNGWI